MLENGWILVVVRNWEGDLVDAIEAKPALAWRVARSSVRKESGALGGWWSKTPEGASCYMSEKLVAREEISGVVFNTEAFAVLARTFGGH